VDCESLTIEGDVFFEKNVTVKGDVKIKNSKKLRADIEEGSVIERDITL